MDERLELGLSKMGIQKLTQIQAQCFEPALAGRNIIGCSRTGTGKTLAYLLPVISANIDNQSLYCVIITPSKELCIQICIQINSLSNNSGIPVTAVALFMGVNKARQAEAMKRKPNIVVGTHQCVYELIKARKLPAHLVKTLVLDEADRLLSSDNINGITALRKCFMRDIQIMLFSASITTATQKAAELLSDNFVKIFTNEKLEIPTNIEHLYFVTTKREQSEYVRKVIKAINAKKAIIFADSRYDVDEIYQKLEFHNYKVGCLNKNIDKNKRRQIIDGFAKGTIQYLVCSDMAARGLDFAGIEAVINIGLPDKTVDYLHRAGRCGRVGAHGICASIITDNQRANIKAIQKAFGVNMLEKTLYQGHIVRK